MPKAGQVFIRDSVLKGFAVRILACGASTNRHLTFSSPRELLAKGQLKVVLTGEGGDEIFCGYSRYRRARWLWGRFTKYARTRGEFDGLGSMNGRFAGWRDGLNLAERQQARAQWTFVQQLQAVDCAEWLPRNGCPMIC